MVTHTYEIVPKGKPRFEPFIMDVPSLDHVRERSARRAYFTAMSYLQNVAEPEDFQVFDWNPTNNERGPERGPDGNIRMVI